MQILIFGGILDRFMCGASSFIIKATGVSTKGIDVNPRANENGFHPPLRPFLLKKKKTDALWDTQNTASSGYITNWLKGIDLKTQSDSQHAVTADNRCSLSVQAHRSCLANEKQPMRAQQILAPYRKGYNNLLCILHFTVSVTALMFAHYRPVFASNLFNFSLFIFKGVEQLGLVPISS